jgi:hypothetical protein
MYCPPRLGHSVRCLHSESLLLDLLELRLRKGLRKQNLLAGKIVSRISVYVENDQIRLAPDQCR